MAESSIATNIFDIYIKMKEQDHRVIDRSKSPDFARFSPCMYGVGTLFIERFFNKEFCKSKSVMGAKLSEEDQEKYNEFLSYCQKSISQSSSQEEKDEANKKIDEFYQNIPSLRFEQELVQQEYVDDFPVVIPLESINIISLAQICNISSQYVYSYFVNACYLSAMSDVEFRLIDGDHFTDLVAIIKDNKKDDNNEPDKNADQTQETQE